MTDFEKFRTEYPKFIYESYSIGKVDDEIILNFRFSAGERIFEPQTRIKINNINPMNDFDSDTAKKIVFCLGLVEAVSYWKATCSPEVRVLCGKLSEADILWFKKLWFNGLGELFYRNGIETDIDSFVSIICEGEELVNDDAFVGSGINIIPIGGGKDSAVTTELLRKFKDKNMFFTVNDQPARTQCVEAAGYDESKIIKTYRTIAPELLQMNREGFINGHTPFSAIVAFLSYYCAYLIGAENIVLSNESSANESNISGETVNHQYSKSYEFEKDFAEFTEKNFGNGISYFSLLRCFNEAQIAKMFASHEKYLGVFKSCNAGSKKNIWCCNCAKCLFVFIMLSPFTQAGALENAFGCNMLEKSELINDFKGLCAFSDVKPFECVGTSTEVCAMLELTLKKYQGEELPVLLKYYKENRKKISENEINDLMSEFNEINFIPEKFLPAVREMYEYVSAVD